MRVCVVGAGAIGACIAGKLILGGHDVTVVARGATLAALRSGGLRLEEPDGTVREVPEVCSTESLRQAGKADLVFLATKAQQAPALAAELGAALKDGAGLVTLQNGIPWWFADNLRSVDPDGALARSIPTERVTAAVVYAAAEIVAPGYARMSSGPMLVLGNGDVERVKQALDTAGVRSKISADIRVEIWQKLLGNVAFNPLSALTRSRNQDILASEEGVALARALMAETQAVAKACGVQLELAAEKILSGAAKAGSHKTSMLQDLEQGRALEVGPITGAVLELATRHGVPVPRVEAVHACMALLNSKKGSE